MNSRHIAIKGNFSFDVCVNDSNLIYDMIG
jgi:hypothetical protein